MTPNQSISNARISPLGAVQDFAPGQIRYIKLGSNEIWAADALSKGYLPFGYPRVQHENCKAGAWSEVRAQLEMTIRDKGAVTRGLRELREFYELPADTLWITMADGHLWWAFAEVSVEALPAGSSGPARRRRTKSGWCKHSLTGQPLDLSGISSAIRRTSSYRMTICNPPNAESLVRLIRGDASPLEVRAAKLQSDQRGLAAGLIKQLDWRDLEILVDLIFSRGGWHRTGALGKSQAHLDLSVRNPLSGKRAWVQVKSQAEQKTLDGNLERFCRDGSYDYFFFVCPNPTGALSLGSDPKLEIWTDEKLAKLTVELGLFGWLVSHTG